MIQPVGCPVAAHRSRSYPPRGQDFVGENDGMIEWSNIIGILTRWRLCRKIKLGGGDRFLHTRRSRGRGEGAARVYFPRYVC